MIFMEICDPCADYYYNKLFFSRAQYKGNEQDSMTRQRRNFLRKTAKGLNEKSFPRDILKCESDTNLSWAI